MAQHEKNLLDELECVLRRFRVVKMQCKSPYRMHIAFDKSSILSNTQSNSMMIFNEAGLQCCGASRNVVGSHCSRWLLGHYVWFLGHC